MVGLVRIAADMWWRWGGTRSETDHSLYSVGRSVRLRPSAARARHSLLRDLSIARERPTLEKADMRTKAHAIAAGGCHPRANGT